MAPPKNTQRIAARRRLVLRLQIGLGLAVLAGMFATMAHAVATAPQANTGAFQKYFEEYRRQQRL